MLAEVTSGLYFAALKQSSAQNLDRLAETYRSHTHSRVRASFGSWEEALAALLALGENGSEPVVVVMDEFSYLLDGAPEVSLVLQSLLSPRGEAARAWRTRLILCGSALSTMRGLLAGSAPLRGRAALDLMVHPFDYREAAEFCHVAHDPGLAVRLHALLGGTPAYRDMVGGHGPGGDELFDDWVAATLLNPASAMFREGNVLLSEENRTADTTTYLSVLSAISRGATRRGEIAAAIGRPQSALAHPLAVLTEARLIAPLADAFKQKRTTFHVAEPIARLNQLIVRPNEARLSRHRGADIWAASAGTVAAQIFGPHFDDYE